MLNESAVGGVGLRVRWEGDDCVLEVSGELDLCSGDLLLDALDALVDTARVVVVDLAEVPFADCAGIRPIVAAAARARARGREITVRHVPASVERIESVTGLPLRRAQSGRLAS